MNRQNGTVSYYIGSAYILLAFISISTELPGRVVCAIALGAVCFSISELLRSFTGLTVKYKSFIDWLEKEKEKPRVALVSDYIVELIRNKNIEDQKDFSKIDYVSGLFQVLAFLCILVYPYTNWFTVFNQERLGVFCTILSLGLILLSTFINEIYKMKKDREYNMELIGGLTALFDSWTKVFEETLENSQNKGELIHKKELLEEEIRVLKDGFVEANQEEPKKSSDGDLKKNKYPRKKNEKKGN